MRVSAEQPAPWTWKRRVAVGIRKRQWIPDDTHIPDQRPRIPRPGHNRIRAHKAAKRGQILPGGHINGTVTTSSLTGKPKTGRHRPTGPFQLSIWLVALLGDLRAARVGGQRGAAAACPEERRVVAIQVGQRAAGRAAHRHPRPAECVIRLQHTWRVRACPGEGRVGCLFWQDPVSRSIQSFDCARALVWCGLNIVTST